MARRGAAIVIGGAVAKGAFAAGALERVVEALGRDGTPIRSLVGTSSGALDATVLAAGVHAGDAAAAARTLTRMWREDAGLLRVVSLDPWSALRARGASRPDRVLALLDAACAPFRSPPGPVPVALRVVVAPLAGRLGPRTSFEQVEVFAGADLDAPERRSRVFRAAAASAAFPYAFEPVELEGVGPCVDGGVVNNTPVAHALEGHAEIDVVYAIVAEPADQRIDPRRAARLGGVSLGLRLVEMLIDERLVRDLDEARAVNRWLARLDALEREGRLSPEARRDVVHALYGHARREVRQVELVEIRPAAALPGNAFSGFVSASLREAYLDAGRSAAERALAAAEEGVTS